MTMTLNDLMAEIQAIIEEGEATGNEPLVFAQIVYDEPSGTCGEISFGLDEEDEQEEEKHSVN